MAKHKCTTVDLLIWANSSIVYVYFVYLTYVREVPNTPLVDIFVHQYQ